MQFTQRVIEVTEDLRRNVTMLRYSIELPDGLAFIDWELNGELYYIKVPEADRRQGIATMLWSMACDYAHSNNLDAPRHSQYRSDSGDAWAKSMADELPTRIAI